MNLLTGSHGTLVLLVAFKTSWAITVMLVGEEPADVDDDAATLMPLIDVDGVDTDDVEVGTDAGADAKAVAAFLVFLYGG